MTRGRPSAAAQAAARTGALMALGSMFCVQLGVVGAASALGLGAAACWAFYILLTQRVSDAVSGLQGLAISMPVAALVATGLLGPSVIPELTWQHLLIGLGLAVQLPVVPFALEMLALRRMTTASFGTLMALEPAMALILGLVILSQQPVVLPVIGILFVVAAGIGAERTGARVQAETPPSARVDGPGDPGYVVP